MNECDEAVILFKLIFVQLGKIITHILMIPRGLLLCSDGSATSPFPEPHGLSPHLTTLFLRSPS